MRIDLLPETDVLVVGGGGAGLAAALTARRSGARTHIVSKSPVGLGNATAIASGTFRAALGSFSAEAHYDETVKAGRGLCNRDLVKILVNEAPRRILELRELGAPLETFSGGAEIEGHHTQPSPGKKVTLVLRKVAQDFGVVFLDRVMAVDLLLSGRRVAGALVHQSGSLGLLLAQAKAVVLATGGIGGLYPHSTNPRQNTGDGQAAALRAGATLQDMEFVQFVPFGVVESGLPTALVPAEVMDHIPLVNADGEEFLARRLGSWGIERLGEVNRYARDHGTLAICREIEEGRGHEGAVLLRLSSVQPGSWEIPEMRFFRKHILRRFPLTRDLHVAPIAHFSTGGVSISTNGGTNLEGLFAAGEIAGGLHGANRLGGNALSETLVFGARAGAAASEYSLTVALATLPRAAALQMASRYEHSLHESGDVEIEMLREELRGAAKKHLGPLRSEAGLEAFLEDASRIRELRQTACVMTSRDLRGYLELENMLTVSEAIACSALARQESRGAHYRSDYPEPRDEMGSKHTLLGPGRRVRVR